MSETRRLEKVIFFILFLEVAPPLPPRLLTHEHAQTSMLKRWRSWLPVLYNSIYLKQGGGVFRLGKQAEEISNSSVACSCIRKVHSCPQAIFVLFLVKTCGGGAEEWCRTLYFQLFAQTCNDEPLFDRCRSKLQKRCSILQTNSCTSQVREFKCGCSLLRREPRQNHF